MRRPPQVRHLSFGPSLPHLQVATFAPNRLHEDVLTHLYRPASVVVHLLHYRPLQFCFLQFKDCSLQPCNLLCAFRICTSGTRTPWIIKLISRLESSCAMRGTHKNANAMGWDDLTIKCKLLNSYINVGMTGFNNATSYAQKVGSKASGQYTLT